MRYLMLAMQSFNKQFTFINSDLLPYAKKRA